MCRSLGWRIAGAIAFVIPPQVGEGSFVMSVSVSVCLCVSPRAYLQNYTSDLYQLLCILHYDRGSVLPWRCCDMSCTSGLVDDVIFAHNETYRHRCSDWRHCAVVRRITPLLHRIGCDGARWLREPRRDESTVRGVPGAEPAMPCFHFTAVAADSCG